LNNGRRSRNEGTAKRSYSHVFSAELRNVGAPFIRLNVTGNIVQQNRNEDGKEGKAIRDLYFENKVHERN